MTHETLPWMREMLLQEQGRAARARVFALYLPVALCLLAYGLRRTRIRTFASPLLSLLWTLPALLLLQRLNLHFGWWSFDRHTACLLDMPVALYLGWAVFWGLLPQLAWPRLDVLAIAIVAFSFDLLVMLFLSPALVLHQQPAAGGTVPVWLVGEAMAILLVLVPAMFLFRWTETNTHLAYRATGQVLLAGLVFLYLAPELTFALRPMHQQGWRPLLTMPRFALELWLQLMLLLAVPGISAVQEFAARGHGTPLPYDPPLHLVTSGIYRYCANPMQLSCTAVMLTEALLLHNAWLVAVAGMAAIYSAGLAHWDEEVDLQHRFAAALPGNVLGPTPPLSWSSYRAAVPAWSFRWRPFVAGPPATLYVAASCATCSGVRTFLEDRSPAGLRFVDAEVCAPGQLRRLRYESAQGAAESGVCAFARALEHLSLGWAFCGFLLRLPIVHNAAQLLTDCAGFGPRTLPSTLPGKAEP